MTRQHFEIIAEVINNAGLSNDARLRIAEKFADRLAMINPRFDKARFMEAAGLNN